MQACPLIAQQLSQHKHTFAHTYMRTHTHTPHTKHTEAHLRIMAIRVEHDDGVRQHVRSVRASKDAWVGPEEVVAKGVDDAVDFLRLSG